MAHPNLVIARYRDGTLIKGVTYDFGRDKRSFHVHVLTGGEKGIEEVFISDLKAVFFVRDLAGFPEYREKREFPLQTKGFKIKIEFFDGETLVGITTGYSTEKEGFWVFPADLKSNNLRIYVVGKSVKRVEKIGFFEREEEEEEDLIG